MGLLWLVVGCASNDDPTAGWTVEKLHEEAKSEMAAGAFEKAIGLYDKLEGRAAGTVLSQQAQLEKAFAQFKNNEPILAVATLDRFIRLNPVNPALDYALYLKGTINFNDDLGLLGGILMRCYDTLGLSALRDDNKRILEKNFPNSPLLGKPIVKVAPTADPLKKPGWKLW